MYILNQNKTILAELCDIEIRTQKVKVGENTRMFSSREPILETRYILAAMDKRVLTDSDGLCGSTDQVFGQFSALERAKRELAAIVDAVRQIQQIYEVGHDPSLK